MITLKTILQASIWECGNFPSYCYSDGHGVLGHFVSGYLKEYLAVTLDEAFQTQKYKDYKKIIEDTFKEVCFKLNNESEIDTKFRYAILKNLVVQRALLLFTLLKNLYALMLEIQERYSAGI